MTQEEFIIPEEFSNVMTQEKLNEDLRYACRNSNVEIVKLLIIREGANVNATNGYGQTALHWAAWNGYIEIVKLLIKYGANINFKDKWGRTALHYAACNGHTEAVKILIKANAYVDAKDKNGNTALSWAAWFKRTTETAIVELLEQTMKDAA